jgi:hypothetical protein
MKTAVLLSRGVPCLVAALALVLPGCGAGTHLTIFGYTSAPNYDPCIRTVYVPIAKNATYRLGLEFDLTRAVIREIESKTPWKVTSDPTTADSELLLNVAGRSKAITNFNQLGEVRDAETTLTVEVVWRDLRPGTVGQILSRPIKVTDPMPEESPVPTPEPVLVQSLATFVPEIGQSLSSAEKVNIDQMAVRIVSMMEKPW